MNDDLATALEAASNNASALEAICTNPDDADQADIAQRRLLFAAMEANSVSAMEKLGTTEQNQANLNKLTTNMNNDTAALAKSEANLAKFVALGTSAVGLAGALVATPVNVAGGMAAVGAMLATLGR